jgi:hypothetical protein
MNMDIDTEMDILTRKWPDTEMDTDMGMDMNFKH